MENECKRAGRLIGGCKFEARYDVIPPEGFGMYDCGVVQFLLPHEIETRTKHIYVCDVCVRCGKAIERGER